MLLKKVSYLQTLFALLLSFCYANTSAQYIIRIDDHWQFLKQDIGGIWEAVRPIKKDNPESYPVWQSVQLPHCVNATDAVDSDTHYYQGPAWYRTQLSINNPYNNGRTILHFEGAGQKTEVYVYTTKVGSHIGGYDEWSVDITDAVEAFKKDTLYQKQFKGKIPISVRTDNSRDLEMIPSSLSDFTIYGGIYRHLNLVYEPLFSIDKLFISSSVDAKGKEGKICVQLRLYNPSNVASAIISVKLIDNSGKVIQHSKNIITDLKGDIFIDEFSVKSPQLWSPDDPGLYGIEVTIKDGENVCTKKEQFGFRHASFVKKGPFLLNGKRLLLKGTHRHEDHAGVGAAMTDEMQRKEMLLIKEMGVNFIRLGHYQQSKYILDLCDSLGILVWEEIPWCRGGLGGDQYKAQAKRMLTNMIEQHYDHPSVIIWGLGNENDWAGDFSFFDTFQIRVFMSELNVLAHSLDPSRSTAIRRCDFCNDIPDIYSPSIWAGWYKGNYTDYKNFTQKEFNKVDRFLHVEWGGDSHAGRYSEKAASAVQQFVQTSDTAAFIASLKNAKDGDWNENYIAYLIDWHLREQENMPWLSGTAAWTFKDFATPIRPENPVPYVNQKGVVERDGTPKELYYVFQSHWATKPMAHIFGQNMPVRWGNIGEAKMINVYSNCDKAELFLNGKSLGVKLRNSQAFPAAGLSWNTALQAGINNVIVVATKGKITVRDSLQFRYQTEKWNKPALAIISKIKEADGVAKIQIKLVDENGVQCMDAVNWVRFGLTGDGKLLDDLGTSTGSRYVQARNGMAAISIKTNAGKNVVSAKVDGLQTVFIEL